MISPPRVSGQKHYFIFSGPGRAGLGRAGPGRAGPGKKMKFTFPFAGPTYLANLPFEFLNAISEFRPASIKKVQKEVKSKFLDDKFLDDKFSDHGLGLGLGSRTSDLGPRTSDLGPTYLPRARG